RQSTYVHDQTENFIPLLNSVLHPTKLAARNEGDRAQPTRAPERPDEVQVGDRLAEGRAPGVERRWARGPHRRVIRVVDEKVKRVAPMREAEVHVPGVDGAPHTGRRRLVVDHRMDLREEAEGV